MSASKRTDGDTPSLSATRPVTFMPIIVALPRVVRTLDAEGSSEPIGGRGHSVVSGSNAAHATAYHSNVLEALVTGKHITEKDAEISAKTQDVVRMAPSRMLSDEVQRRLLVYEATLRKV